MEYVVQGNLPLTRGSLVRIAGGRDMLIYVWSGAVWITEEGDRSDRYVTAGGWFRVASAGLTLVSALERSAITLTSPHEHEFAERIEVVRAGTANLEPLFAAPGALAALRARIARSLAGWFAPKGRPIGAAS